MMEYLIFLIGILFLIKGSDYLVEGSSLLAKKLRINSLLVGLTIVAFGTSTPELIVSVFSALKGSTDIALGNIIGSNIANILLIFGVVSLISPIKFEHSTIRKEIPYSLFAAVILFLSANYFFSDLDGNKITEIGGLIFLVFFGVFLYAIFGMAKKSRSEFKIKDIGIHPQKNRVIFLMIFLGLIGLYFGGIWVVEGALFISENLGLSQFFISATIIAIGTSLPELVVGVRAAKRKESEIAVGNVVGSNIFNIFWVLGITAIISPIAISNFVNFDMIFLILATTMLFLFLYLNKNNDLKRWHGVLFILIYIFYLAYNFTRG